MKIDQVSIDKADLQELFKSAECAVCFENKNEISALACGMYVCMHACIYVCICMNICVCMHECVCGCAFCLGEKELDIRVGLWYVCMHACMHIYVCMYEYMYIYA